MWKKTGVKMRKKKREKIEENRRKTRTRETDHCLKHKREDTKTQERR